MAHVVGAHNLLQELAREGLLPPECVAVEVLMPLDGIFQLRYTVNIIGDDLPKVIRALSALAERMGVEP